MGYTLLYRGHVAIDLIYEKFSRRTRAIVNVISYVLFFFPFVGVMIWQGTVFAQTSWAMKETSWSVFAPPLYPVKTVIPVAFALLLIQGISVFISQILVLVRGK
jgi:TRAP-type mannitol/chloroaromatic compound transport system permease small subunit